MVMNLCVTGIDVDSVYDFDIGLWNCSDSVVFCTFSLYDCSVVNS